MINGINNNPYNDYYSSYKLGNNDRNVNGMTPEGECQTCKERKYQDGSDEMVSFKAASHISPEAAPAMVCAHEGEHVSNAFKSASMNDGEVVSASVSIHMDRCPECGRSYVSGGTTTTMIKYNKDPYAQNTKKLDQAKVIGQNVDARC